MGGLVEALNGEFVLPGPGGDPIRNPDVLPTGRNMHALDPQAIPTSAACDCAKVRAAYGFECRRCFEHGHCATALNA